MSRRFPVLFVLGLGLISIPAAADEPTDKSTSSDAEPPSAAPSPAAPAPTAPPLASEVKPVEQKGAWYQNWETSVTGYFRAPLALGLSSRPSPDNLKGPSSTQVSYGPNRTVDANYFAFTYTRLQEQDWAELFVHEKHKHVEAVLGMMGYWYQTDGFRVPDASWFPGMAYLVLDTDFKVGPVTPNIALTMGAWWPKFGYFEKYDTYTLGRFRQVGEQLRLTIPVGPRFTTVLTQGFGTNRDGSYNYESTNNPLYNTLTFDDLLTYENIEVTDNKYIDVGLHYNTMWTADPNAPLATTNANTPTALSYTNAEQAHLTVLGAEANLTVPYAGRLWLSPSFISVRNGWALGGDGAGGTEVMHSMGGAGIASNYMGYAGNPTSSTGSGSMVNFGFLYENKLSNILGKPKGSVMPEVTLSVFGLLADASVDLPANVSTPHPPPSFKEFKYGADLTVQPLDWLGFVLRYDFVNLDLDLPAYVYSVITPRIVFSSHFLSSESIYIQYSRYTYGDKMVLAGTWPWNQNANTGALVPGNGILQGQGPYAGKEPDANVIKLQATVAF
jgi:hypothetical protein